MRPEQVAVLVVAATVGLEVLGSRNPTWLAPRTVSGFWRLLLPLLASHEVLTTLEAEGA
ncbi:hypothetical protein NKH18_01945 [Streptomyces sp. M10(2022)]